jgi:hypothetical protein
MSGYISDVLLGLDMFASTLIPGGVPGETLSGRAGSAQQQGHLRGRICAPCINFLAFNRNHCKEAIYGDIRRAKAIIANQSKP